MSKPELIQPLFLPRGVAEPSGKIGYVTNANNGIDAIDLNNGKRLWTNNTASIPLLATASWLTAQKVIPERANLFQIIKLDTEQKGRLIWLSEPIVFPEWVSVRSPNTEDFSLKVYASTDRLLLDWQARSRYRGGANPPGAVLQQSTRENRGKVRVDLKSGKVEMLPLADRETVLPKDASLDEQFGSGWWIAGQNLAVLVWEEFKGQQVLQLKTRGRSTQTSVEVEKVVELARGKALVSNVTPDGCYILVYPDLPQQLHSHQQQPWWIFSAETGHLLKKLNYDPGTQSASIFNSQIYYLVDREIDSKKWGVTVLQSVLKAKDLSSGQLRWEYLLQEQPIRQPPPLPQ